MELDDYQIKHGEPRSVLTALLITVTSRSSLPATTLTQHALCFSRELKNPYPAVIVMSDPDRLSYVENASGLPA